MSNAVALAQSASNNVTMRNRIINPGMVIDQRNAGASYAQINNSYSLDRWIGFSYAGVAVTGKFTVQQTPSATETGYATRIAAGFTNYLAVTSSTTTADASTNIFAVSQKIEGFNCSDLAWGTANAKTVTLSFLVRSSLTGTFGGSIQNNAQDRSYPFSYTISSANTWEQKTITVAGDTSGTWLTTNGVGMFVNLGLGVGTTFSGTAGAWAGANYYSATGATSVVGTNGATFYITGVQLEKGSTATPFEQRLYTTELQLCQRYLPAFNATAISQSMPSVGYGTSTVNVNATYIFNVTARVAPTGISVNNATYFSVSDGVTNTTCTATTFTASSVNSCIVGYSVASGLTQYRPYTPYANNATAQLLFTGCEL